MSAVGQANVPVQRRRGSAVRCNRLLGVIVPLAPEYNMGGFLRRNELNAFVSHDLSLRARPRVPSPRVTEARVFAELEARYYHTLILGRS